MQLKRYCGLICKGDVMRKMILIAVGVVSLSGCGNARNVYDRPIPNRDDRNALLDIRDKLKPEDEQAWQGIVMRLVNPMAERVTSKTVGEAIARLEAKTACMDSHDPEATKRKIGDGPNDIAAPDYEAKNTAYITANNKEVAAYNACLKMPV